MKCAVLVGAAGAGKGTQANLLVERMGVVHCSTGDLLRQAVAKGSDLGRRVEGFMAGGALVPDDVVLDVVAAAMRSFHADAFVVFDGFPRTYAQAEALAGRLVELGAEFSCAAFVDVPLDVLRERLAGRRVCLACGQTYHVVYNPAPPDGQCSSCGSDQIRQRPDDVPEVVEKRLKAFEAQREALISWYGPRGEAVVVSGLGSVDEVYGRLVEGFAQGSRGGLVGT